MLCDDAIFINTLREYLGLDPLHRDGRSLEDGYYNQPQVEWLPYFIANARADKLRKQAR